MSFVVGLTGGIGSGKSTVADLISPATPAPAKAAPASRSASRGLTEQLARLGLVRDQDLVLHLPLRYEDHTRIVPLAYPEFITSDVGYTNPALQVVAV